MAAQRCSAVRRPRSRKAGDMRHMGIARPGERLSVLCIGAHPDDIEIGAGATILGWIDRGVHLDVHWAVLSATGRRREEAHASAKSFLATAHSATIDVANFQDGFFPYQGADIKAWFEQLRRRTFPDVILCHWHNDAHQDHRQVSSLTWNTFRDHPILEYEIPKWDGDLGQPNVYFPTRAPPGALWLPAVQGLVRRGNLPEPRTPARCGMSRPRRICGGLPRPKADIAMTT